ncbi:hypothetical protein AAC387_Pa03g1674 [Persea americana]
MTVTGYPPPTSRKESHSLDGVRHQTVARPMPSSAQATKPIAKGHWSRHVREGISRPQEKQPLSFPLSNVASFKRLHYDINPVNQGVLGRNVTREGTVLHR